MGDSQLVAVGRHYGSVLLSDEDVCRSDRLTFGAENIGLTYCKFLEGGRHIDGVVFIQESFIGLFKFVFLNKVVWIFPVVCRLEQGGGERMCDRVSYESESFHISGVCDATEVLMGVSLADSLIHEDGGRDRHVE